MRRLSCNFVRSKLKPISIILTNLSSLCAVILMEKAVNHFFAETSSKRIRPVRKLGRKVLVVSCLAAATPALAQVTNCMANGPFLNCHGADGSNTTCNSNGPMLNCHTVGGRAESSAAETSGQEGSLMGFVRSMRERKVRARAVKALQAGDCSKAMAEALRGSDSSLFRNIQTYCSRQAASGGQESSQK